MEKKEMTYEGTGVNYQEMDPFKVAATKAAMTTGGNIERFGLEEVAASRGESAYLMKMSPDSPFAYLAHVEEGLGTKNKVAEEMIRVANNMNARYLFGRVGQCTVAMIVNDIITLGALPISVAMHLAVGASTWFKDEARWQSLINNWVNACNLGGCVWSGGETPTLKGIVDPESVVLAGSAVGIIPAEENYLNGGKIRHGDSIVLIMSSGIHANGLTMAREIADKLPDGFFTKLPSGRIYGEALLEPTIIYAPLIEECQKRGVELHYAVNITGHGWRKLMRAQEKFEYIIDRVPESQEVFPFILKHGPISEREAYGNLNMGAGFALYLPAEYVLEVVGIAGELGMVALDAGDIRASEKRSVCILPKRLVYGEEELKVR